VVEGRRGHGLRVQSKKAREGNQQAECENVVSRGFEEPAPGKSAVHKYIGPEWRGAGLEFERRQTARVEEIAEIC
jgi:hypothetical protein